ncbi:MAG: hypothetical protein H7A26_06740 [Spirochaetales bacterium]|nr:hypothetical protein [Spirochaetales bacterium]
MKMMKISPYRIYLLFKRDLRENMKSLIIASSAVSVFIFFLINESAFEHTALYPLFLYTGGFIYTSACFREIHQRDRNSVYLLLPASVIEKFIQRLVTTTIVWIVFSLVLYSISSFAAVFSVNYAFNAGLPHFNPFSSEIFRTFPVYIINSSLFFLGSVYFRKMHFFKTLLSLSAFFLLTLIIVSVFARFIFSRDISILFSSVFEKNFGLLDYSVIYLEFEKIFSVFIKTLRLLYFTAVAPLFWFVSYLRLKEVQVRDGI